MHTIIKAGTSEEADLIEVENRQLAEKIAEDGIVLLENDGILPLQGKRIALFGSGSRKTVKGGTGSGAVRERYSVSIEQGLQKEGFTITTSSRLDAFDEYYDECYEAYRQNIEKKIEGITEFYKILGITLQNRFNVPVGMDIKEEDMSTPSDTAIYVISRQAGEGADRKNIKGDFLLEDIEVNNLQKVSSHYKNLIVVINVGGLIDLSPLDAIHYNALIYMGQSGEEGGDALAALLCGKADFSGRMSMTWPLKYEDVPSAAVYGEASSDQRKQFYTEDQYVGYRYYESFQIKARYLFGYGLSYTSFEEKIENWSQEKEEIIFTVKITNTGNHAGKAPVLLYASLPETKEDHEYRRLIGFQKTDSLLPKESVLKIVKVNLQDLTIYDREQAQFLLPAGKFSVFLGDSVNTLRPSLCLHVSEPIVTETAFSALPLQEECKTLKAPYHAMAAADLPMMEINVGSISHKTCNYKIYPDAENEIREKVARMDCDDLVNLVIGATTQPDSLQVTALGASGSTTPHLYDKYGIPNIILSDGPQGLNLTNTIVEMPEGTVKAARVPHVLEAYKRYLFGIAGKGLLSKMASPEEGTVHYQYATAWPSELVLAQTFDPQIAEKMGDGIAREMEKFGVTIWLGPAMNIERNPMGGRTYEYYSEDPLHSGYLAAAVIHGVQKHPGCGVCVKHFAANNVELFRNESDSIMSERALREIYLKGFEIVMREAEPMSVMASYNKINGVYNPTNEVLLNHILREEWGFDGLVMSDWDAVTPKTADLLKAHSSGCDLIMPGRKDQNEALKAAIKDGTVHMDDILRSAERILKVILQNRALQVEKKSGN